MNDDKPATAAAAKLLVLTTRADLAEADTQSALADVDEIDARPATSRRRHGRTPRPDRGEGNTAPVGPSRPAWGRIASARRDERGPEAATTVTVAPLADRSKGGVATD